MLQLQPLICVQAPSTATCCCVPCSCCNSLDSAAFAAVSAVRPLLLLLMLSAAKGHNTASIPRQPTAFKRRTFCSCVCSPTSGILAASRASAQHTAINMLHSKRARPCHYCCLRGQLLTGARHSRAQNLCWYMLACQPFSKTACLQSNHIVGMQPRLLLLPLLLMLLLQLLLLQPGSSCCNAAHLVVSGLAQPQSLCLAPAQTQTLVFGHLTRCQDNLSMLYQDLGVLIQCRAPCFAQHAEPQPSATSSAGHQRTSWGGSSSKLFVVSTSFSAYVLLLVHSTASSPLSPLISTLHSKAVTCAVWPAAVRAARVAAA